MIEASIKVRPALLEGNAGRIFCAFLSWAYRVGGVELGGWIEHINLAVLNWWSGEWDTSKIG